MEYAIHNRPIRALLLELAEKGNKPFTESLNPGVEHILGVSIPDLRKLARQIAKEDWQTYLACADSYYMEERMLQGLVIGYIPHLSIEERLELMERFVPFINSWSVCDTFCATLKIAKADLGRVLEFVSRCLQSDNEYTLRFGIVMLLENYIESDYLPFVFEQLNAICHEGYYVKMAVAWTLSVCFVKYPSETETFLQKNQLDAFTQNKTIQKINESLRVSKEDKMRLRQYKK